MNQKKKKSFAVQKGAERGERNESDSDATDDEDCIDECCNKNENT